MVILLGKNDDFLHLAAEEKDTIKRQTLYGQKGHKSGTQGKKIKS